MNHLSKFKILFLLLITFFTASVLLAKDVPFTVLPWNGYKAALSLTYDDGDPIHLDVAIPEMQKRGLRGTFYLIAGKLTRVDDWNKAAQQGQEIGNHTMTHRHVSDLNPNDDKDEVVEAKKKLQEFCGVPILTLAYPFVEISPGLRKWVQAEEFAARGGGSANPYLVPDMEPDWFNIPSQVTMTPYAYQTYQNWVDQDLSAGAWTVLMIHAIEGSTWYEPISKETYLKFLDYLVTKKENLWVAPFGEVCAYWQAQKVLEKIDPQRDGDKTTLHWEKPTNFPKGVVVKLNIKGTGLLVTQNGKTLNPESKDVYDVSFDPGELTLIKASWQPIVVGVSTTPIVAKEAVIDSSTVISAPLKNSLLVDDFESSVPEFGSGWWEGCDTNGTTKVSPNPYTTMPGGSPKSSGHCAGMAGHLGPQQAPWPWAVLSLNLNAGGTPVDLSQYKALRFYTKGDGKTHGVALNKASVLDYCDFQASFLSPGDWTYVTIPFSKFTQPNWGKQLEKKFNDITKLTFTPGTSDPNFDFKIDDVELLKELPPQN